MNEVKVFIGWKEMTKIYRQQKRRKQKQPNEYVASRRWRSSIISCPNWMSNNKANGKERHTQASTSEWMKAFRVHVFPSYCRSFFVLKYHFKWCILMIWSCSCFFHFFLELYLVNAQMTNSSNRHIISPILCIFFL